MVSIIILSYNTEELIIRCLNSVVKHTKRLQHEIIVVDNASFDNSVEMIQKKFPEVKLIKNMENVGFAKGVNIAAEKAKGDYLLLVNSDTEFTDESIKDMVEYMENHDDVAIVGGHLKNADNSTSKSFGKFYTLIGVYKMLFTDKRQKEEKLVSPLDVDWVSGGYMLIRKNDFRNMHGFDEHFFMYLEDMELCYRLREKGKRVVYFPNSSISHAGQGSSNRTFAIVQIYKGLKYFYKKHKSFPENALLTIMLIVKALSAIVIGVVSGNSYLTTTYKKALSVAL